MNKYVIVYGPPCSGKSLNAQAIASYFKCDYVTDESLLSRFLTGKILVLSHTNRVRNPNVKVRKNHPDYYLKGTAYSVEEVAAHLGGLWVKPIPNYQKSKFPITLDLDRPEFVVTNLFVITEANKLIASLVEYQKQGYASCFIKDGTHDVIQRLSLFIEQKLKEPVTPSRS